MHGSVEYAVQKMMQGSQGKFGDKLNYILNTGYYKAPENIFEY
jgi:hypothetical protein